MNIAIIGTGYVGLVTGVSLAVGGHHVMCVGRNREKIDAINNGDSPFYEPRLDDLLRRVLKKKLLHATDDIKESVRQAHVVILAVGTPTVHKEIDLSAIKEVARQVGSAMREVSAYQIVVVKSTVIPTTTEKVIKPILEHESRKKVGSFGLCMNPEFLREGNAVEDALHPDRIVIGQYDAKSGNSFAELYRTHFCPKLFTNLQTAEIIKYAANAFFATTISYANEIARIAEATSGVDVVEVWKGVHLDARLSPIIKNTRISPGILSYIFSGCGYGGSCFPKDTKALAQYAHSIHVRSDIVNSAIRINKTQPMRLINLLERAVGDLKGKRIAVFGLAFKPNTDDVRESPALEVVRLLIKKKAKVFCHDPEVYRNRQRQELKNLPVILTQTIQDALSNADAVLITTAWDAYKDISPRIFKRLMKSPVVIDGRRIYDREVFLKSGVHYLGIGYSSV